MVNRCYPRVRVGEGKVNMVQRRTGKLLFYPRVRVEEDEAGLVPR